MSGLNPKDEKYEREFCRMVGESSDNARKQLEIGSEQFSQMIGLVKDLTKCHKIVGNGWGGYLMHIAEKKCTNNVYNLLVNEFYMSEQNRILLSDDIEQYIQAFTVPGTGLSILNPESEIWF